MKKILFMLMLMFVSNVSADYLGQVDRTQSLPIPFSVLDSVGNPVTLASGDSLYVQCVDPDGTITFRDSMAYNDASIDFSAWEDFSGGQEYTYTENVSTLDGSSTQEGIFTIKIWAQDLTSASLITPTTHTFQMINSPLESMLDSIGLAAVDAQLIYDSLLIVLDSLEALESWIAQQSSLFNGNLNLDNSTGTLSDAQIDDITVGSVTGDVTLDDGEFAIIADTLLQADTSTHNSVVGSFGEFLYKPQTASLSAADIVAIKDTILNADTTSNNNTAGSYGEILSNPAYVQGAASGLSVSGIVNGILAITKPDTVTGTYWSWLIDYVDTIHFASGTELMDSILVILDSLENLEAWVAQQTEVAGLDGWNPITDNDSLIVDQSTMTGGGGGPDTTAIITAIHNNFLPYSPIEYRYISLNGDNSDGLTWATAWTTPDSITSIVTGEGYHFLVEAGDYDPVWHTELLVPNSTIEGVNGVPVFHYNTDTLANGTWDPAGGADVSDCIYINAPGFVIKNIRFTGEGLYAYPEYGADPDGSLSINWRGGKNAILMDTLADFGVIEDCVFDSLYKPIAGYYRNDDYSTAQYGVIIQNNIFHEIEYHAIDAPLAHTVIRYNDFMNTAITDHPSAGAVQLISNIGAYNHVYGNYFNVFGYGAYANVSDSNFFANNYFGLEKRVDGNGDALRAYDNTALADPIIAMAGNHKIEGTSIMPMEGGRNLLGNSGFEIQGKNRREAPLWAGTSWGAALWATGASYEVAPWGFFDPNTNAFFRYGNQGHSLFMMVGDSSWNYMYQNTRTIYLDVGELQLSARILPTTSIVSGDSIRFALFEDTLGDGSFGNTQEYYFESDGGTDWEIVSNNFSIINSGEYYMTMTVWNVDSGDGFYFDDVFLGQYSGNVVASVSTADKEDIAELVKDSASANPSLFYGPSASGSGLYGVKIYTIDTSATPDDTLGIAIVDVNTSTGSNYAGPQPTSTSGDADFNLDAGDYLGLASKGAQYIFPTLSFTITGNDTVAISGYKIDGAPTPPSGANLCRVYGWVRNYQSVVRKYLEVQITTPTATYNICDSSILIPQTFSSEINDTGYFYIDLTKSSCMETLNNGDLQEYIISIPGFRKDHRFTIPADSSTYRIIF